MLCPPFPAGWDAVTLMRFMTCLAVNGVPSLSKYSRISAGSPGTYGAAERGPGIGPCWPWLETLRVVSRSPPPASSEMMFVPGAATLTHGPCIENSATAPSCCVEGTEMTYSEKHGGGTM